MILDGFKFSINFFIIGVLYNYLLIIFSALYSYYLYTDIQSSTNGT